MCQLPLSYQSRASFRKKAIFSPNEVNSHRRVSPCDDDDLSIKSPFAGQRLSLSEAPEGQPHDGNHDEGDDAEDDGHADDVQHGLDGVVRPCVDPLIDLARMLRPPRGGGR